MYVFRYLDIIKMGNVVSFQYSGLCKHKKRQRVLFGGWSDIVESRAVSSIMLSPVTFSHYIRRASCLY